MGVYRKTIFQDATGQLCGKMSNAFLEITEATDFVHVQSEVLIAGKQTKVQKIMLFKQTWLDTYYIKPMERNIERLKRSLAASQSNHCLHCAGNAGKCACSSCPRTIESKCSRTLSLTSLLGALSVKVGEEQERAKDHCAHCKGLAAPCGCTQGCPKPAASTCRVEHKLAQCDSCKESGISGTRYKCGDCHDYDLCSGCYKANAHDPTHSFLQIDRVGCNPVRLAPRKRKVVPAPSSKPKSPPALKTAPTAAASSSGAHGGFFYLQMAPSELKTYLRTNGVSYDDCFEKGDLQRRAWECYCDLMSGPEVVACMQQKGIDPSSSRDIGSRRQRLKQAFQSAERPKEPKPAFKIHQRVMLQGLRRADMNGRYGYIREPATSSPDRAMVQIDGVGTPMLVKYENLSLQCDVLD